MNKESISSFNKISNEMDKLSFLISKDEAFNRQLQSALCQPQPASDSDAEDTLDQYFNDYQNPTTKSIPFEQQDNNNSQIQMSNDEIADGLRTYHRNQIELQNYAGEQENVNDDTSTVIISHCKKVERKNKDQKQSKDGQIIGKDCSYQAKNLTNLQHFPFHRSNLSSEIPEDLLNEKAINQLNVGLEFSKKGSLIRNGQKQKNKQNDVLLSEKLTKQNQQLQNYNHQIIGKIDREELKKLQVKKHSKKSQSSTNRKQVTKRELLSNKSQNHLPFNHKQANNPINYLSNKSVNNASSCQALSSKKKNISRAIKGDAGIRNQWLRSAQKTGKKLNRVNICKLQENLKKSHQKKANNRNDRGHIDLLKPTNNATTDAIFKNRDHLKLNFTQNQHLPAMKMLIKEKGLFKEYAKATKKFEDLSLKITNKFLNNLILEIRETSQQAILKIRILSAIIMFFEQFSITGLLGRKRKEDNKRQYIHCHSSIDTPMTQQKIVGVLQKPKQFLDLLSNLPIRLFNENVLSVDAFRAFMQESVDISEQLDQQLEFFLIKKTVLFGLLHQLTEYLRFLMENQLIDKTQRQKVLLPEEGQTPLVHGYYSSRSKRQNNGKQKSKGKTRKGPIGFRCDSDRKITLEDEELDVFRKTNRGQLRLQGRRLPK